MKEFRTGIKDELHRAKKKIRHLIDENHRLEMEILALESERKSEPMYTESQIEREYIPHREKQAVFQLGLNTGLKKRWSVWRFLGIKK